MAALEPLGFVKVVMSDMSPTLQMDVVRGAEIVVAPHGMGLTHLALHQGRPAVIELFNPTIGSDAYAFLCLARRWSYDFCLGEEVDATERHFIVDVADILDCLEAMVVDACHSRPARRRLTIS